MPRKSRKMSDCITVSFIVIWWNGVFHLIAASNRNLMKINHISTDVKSTTTLRSFLNSFMAAKYFISTLTAVVNVNLSCTISWLKLIISQFIFSINPAQSNQLQSRYKSRQMCDWIQLRKTRSFRQECSVKMFANVLPFLSLFLSSA